MPKKQNGLRKIVLFNASVFLAGLKSPTGGSGKLLSWSKDNKITGVISEIVLDEAIRHADVVGLKPVYIRLAAETVFSRILAAPETENVARFNKLVIDPGDAHVLASGYEAKADFLVTLDKKHLLILQKKIKWVRIVSPGELIGNLDFVLFDKIAATSVKYDAAKAIREERDRADELNCKVISCDKKLTYIKELVKKL